MIMSFKKIQKRYFLWTKMHLIHSFGPVSKGLGPVLDRFEIIIFKKKKFVRRSYFFGKNSRRTTNQIGVALHTCTPDTNVYIIISTRMTKDSVFCLVNVLFCVTYWNIIYKCCTNSKETHKSCACFQYANTAKHST